MNLPYLIDGLHYSLVSKHIIFIFLVLIFLYCIHLLGMCPKGDDPLTVNQTYRAINLQVTLQSLPPNGTLGIQFEGDTLYMPLYGASSSTCVNAFALSQNFEEVNCIFSQPSPNVYNFAITFISWPLLPRQNNLYQHDGNPSRTEFFCDISQMATPASCIFSDLVNSNLQGFWSLLFFTRFRLLYFITCFALLLLILLYD